MQNDVLFVVKVSCKNSLKYKYQKVVIDHCHSTRKLTGAAHNISNSKLNVLNCTVCSFS